MIPPLRAGPVKGPLIVYDRLRLKGSSAKMIDIQ